MVLNDTCRKIAALIGGVCAFPPIGAGTRVRHGLLAAHAPVALFSDADLSTPITEMPKLVHVICDGSCDVAFGSRALDRRLIETPQPFIRDRAGRVFNAALRFATGLPYYDMQCGFKAFRNGSTDA